jgi:hypothetical protein
VSESDSGAKINLDKTEGLWLGSFKHRTDQPMGIHWTSGSVKVLGFYFGNGDLMEQNWKPVINKFKSILNLWMYRNLSMQGRTVVLNSLASSGIWYYSNILPMPKWVFTELNRTMLNFFWKNKKHHVRQDILRQKLEEGGLNLVDIKQKIKAERGMLISKIWQNPQAKWAILADYFIGQYKNINLGKDILLCKILWHRNIKRSCQIYREFMDAWNCLKVIPDPCTMNTLSVMGQNLFLNPNITFGNRNSIFFYVEYINSGLQHIHDIVAYQKLKPFKDLLPILGLKNTKRNRNKYEKLCQAIPKEWMALIVYPLSGPVDKQHFKIASSIDGDDSNPLLDKHFSTKKLYSLLVQDIRLHIPAMARWQQVFHTDNLEPYNIFKHVYEKPLDRKLADLQWKFCHMVINTNHYLCQIKILEEKTCLACGNEDDTLLHAFTECYIAREILYKVRPIFSKLSGLRDPFKLYNLCFGYFSTKKSKFSQGIMYLLNYLLAVVKQAILISRRYDIEGSTVPAHNIFCNIVHSRIKEEFLHVKLNDSTKMVSFIQRWCYEDILCTVDEEFDNLELFKL